MAEDDTTTAPAPVPGIDYNALIQQIMQGGSGITGPAPPATPAVNRNLPFTGMLGEALGGGVSPLYPMSEAQQTQAGNAALLNFGINMLQNSSGPVRHSLGQAIASGLLGAQGSLAGVREGQAQTLDVQNKQQEMHLKLLEAAMPFLRMQQAAGMPNPLAGNAPAPGTGIGATGAPIAPADSSGLNAAGDSATRKAAEGGPPAPNTPGAAVAQRTHDFWIGQGYTEPQVAGILAGGPGSESDFTPTVFGDKGTSYGLYQHHGERLANMQKYFNLPAGQMPTEQQQNQYAAYEISPQGPLASVGAQLRTAKTPAEAATVWTGGFGVPADKSEIARRANGANRFSGIYAPQPAPGGSATPPAASTAPPGVQMGGAVPPPPGGAPGAAATPYQAAGAGIGRVLTDTTGKVGPQQVTVAPPPPNAVPIGKGTPIPTGKLLPKVADNVAAIQAGMQLGQTAPAVTALTAGPGAPTAVATAAPAAPQPGWGSVVGTYGLPGQTPPPTPPTVTPPAQPPPQQPTQGDQPPASTGPLTFEQFQAQHPIAIDPRTFTVTPPNLDNLQRALNEATQRRDLAMRGMGGDVNKAGSDFREASKAMVDAQQAAQTKSLELQQAAQKNALDTQRQLYNDEMTRQQQAKLEADKLAQTAAENEKNRAAEIRKAELGAGYTAEQSERQADIDIAKSDINDRAADAQKASHIIPVLQQMQGQFGNLPGGVVGGLLAKYDTTGDITGMLARMGVVDPSKATAAQLLIAARNYLSIETKPAATGSLRVAEMDKLQSFTPGQLATPQAQQEMIGRLIAYQKRIQDERTFAGNYFGRTDPTTGKRIYDNRGLETAMNAPVQYNENGVVTGGGLGPVVPEPPPLNRPDAEHQAYLNYIHRNVAPGMPYQSWEPKTNPDGSTVRDARGQPVPQRVTKMQGYQ